MFEIGTRVSHETNFCFEEINFETQFSWFAENCEVLLATSDELEEESIRSKLP